MKIKIIIETNDKWDEYTLCDIGTFIDIDYWEKGLAIVWKRKSVM